MVKNKYLLDTNIFLELLLDQEKAKECYLLISKVADGKIKCFISNFTLHSIEVLMYRKEKLKELKEFLVTLKNFKGLKIYFTDINEEIELLKASDRFNLDIDDAFQYYIAKRNCLQIVSFDKHFDKTDIKRIEPAEII